MSANLSDYVSNVLPIQWNAWAGLTGRRRALEPPCQGDPDRDSAAGGTLLLSTAVTTDAPYLDVRNIQDERHRTQRSDANQPSADHQ